MLQTVRLFVISMQLISISSQKNNKQLAECTPQEAELNIKKSSSSTKKANQIPSKCSSETVIKQSKLETNY